MSTLNLTIFISIYATGVMGTRIIVPLISNQYGASTIGIGLIVTLYSLLPLFFSIKIGDMIGKKKSKFYLYLSVIFTGLGLIILYFVHNIFGIILSQLIIGVSQTTLALSIQHYISLAYKANRNSAIAQFSLGMAMGSFVGPLLAGYLGGEFDYPSVFGVLGIISLLSIFFIFNLPEIKNLNANKNEIKNKSISAFYLLENSELKAAILISTIVLMAKEIYIAYFPLLGIELGLSTFLIGLIVSLHAIAGILIRILMEVLLIKFSFLKLINILILTSTLSFIALPFYDNIFIIIGLSFILGLGLGLGQPLSITMTVAVLTSDELGKGLGLRITFNKLTQFLTPVTFGWVAYFFGISGVFWASAITMSGLQLVQRKYSDNFKKEI